MIRVRIRVWVRVRVKAKDMFKVGKVFRVIALFLSIQLGVEGVMGGNLSTFDFRFSISEDYLI